MRVGVALPHYDTSLGGAPASWEGVRSIALRAEAGGLDSVWVSDHLFLDWSKYGGSTETRGALECWTTVAALAAATERVRVGTLAVCNDLRNPGLVAKMAATVALASGGRLEVCMGAGWYEPEYRAADIPFERAGVRIDRLAESVEIIRRLLDGEDLTFKGRHYTMDGAVCRPLPERRPGLWIGGKGDRVVAAAAAAADGWNFSWVGSVSDYRSRAQAADAACERLGRDPATLRRSAGVFVLAGTDDRDLQGRFDRLAARTPPGVIAASLGRGGHWSSFSRRGVTGTIEAVVESLAGLEQAGVEEIVVAPGVLPFQVADTDDIDIIAERIAPALR